jgi:hypothetical protein
MDRWCAVLFLAATLALPAFATVLVAYAGPGEIMLASDGLALTSTGAPFSNAAPKLLLTGTRSACAIGGYCEVIVKEGPRKGKHWKLLDTLAAVKNFPSETAEDRARHLFNAAYRAAADWLPHDSDPGQVGTRKDGIVVLFAEVSKDGSVHLIRADLAVTVQKQESRFSWSVAPPVLRAIVPGTVPLPLIYIHDPESARTVDYGQPKEDRGAAASMEGIVRNFFGHTVGGQIGVIRIDGAGARKLR